MKREMILVDIFTSEFKGQTYEIDVFLDEQTLQTFYGKNIKNLEVGKSYTVVISYNSKKKDKKIYVSNVVD